jgi:uncharacterized membrane-anchored protein
MSSEAPDDVVRPFRRYLSKTPEVTAFFWILKVLASMAGGVIADLLTTTAGLGLERTLSIHPIDTTRREAFYWLAVALTFALGTAGQRFAAHEFAAGRDSVLLSCAAVLVVAWLARRLAGVGRLIEFWISYPAPGEQTPDRSSRSNGRSGQGLVIFLYTRYYLRHDTGQA